MNLSEAIEILKVERGVAALDISNDDDNQHTRDFYEAATIILDHVEEHVEEKEGNLNESKK